MDNLWYPIPATAMVNLYWGNNGYAVKIATCRANDAMREADAWFAENSHFFHLENFPPYRRYLPFEKYTMVDYGSYGNFLYLIPVNT